MMGTLMIRNGDKPSRFASDTRCHVIITPALSKLIRYYHMLLCVIWYHVLSYIVLYYLLLAGIFWYYLVLLCIIWYSLVLLNIISYFFVLSCTVLSYLILSDIILYHLVLYYLISSCIIWYYLVLSVFCISAPVETFGHSGILRGHNFSACSRRHYRIIGQACI